MEVIKQEAPGQAQQENTAQTVESAVQPPSKERERSLSLLLETAVDETVRRAAQSMALETAQIEQDGRIAVMMRNAGLYDDLKNCTATEATARALVKIELGRTMGIGPFEAMNVIYFVNGRPSLDSGIRAARMKRAGYSWEVVKQDEKGCILLLLKDGRYITRPILDENGHFKLDDKGAIIKEPVVVSFLEADAARAGLLSKNGSLYKTYPKIMYFNRCISGAQKTFAPEVLNGSDMVSREEAEETVPVTPQGAFEAAQEILRSKLEDFMITSAASHGVIPSKLEKPTEPREGSGEVADERVMTAKSEEQTATGHGAGTTPVKSPSTSAPGGLFSDGLGGKRK